MNDLISRQALMKEFADFVRASNNSDFAKTPTWNDAVSLVGSMPSAQPEKTLLTVKCELDDEELRRAIEDVKNAELELIAAQQEQQWIPVSERLPEEGVPVLVSAYGNITDGVHERGWWLAWGDRGSYEDEENVVDAWMPLPKPYKGEES